MSDNPIHDLLEAVSAGQPPHRLSVDALVRTGRRRQRGVSLAAAGGTAVVVAGAATLVSQGTGSGTTAGRVTTPPASRVLATAAQPDPSVSFPQGRSTTTTLAVISAAHVLSDGTQVGTFVRTTGCAPSVGLRVVSEDAREVVLSLEVRLVGSEPLMSPSATSSCGPRLTGSATAAAVGSTFETLTRLATPLGGRRLVDQATGHEIPYTADTQTAYTTWLPEGWQDTSGVRPVDLRTWEQDWATKTDGVLSLRQTFGAADQLGGAVNADVNGRPARVRTGQHGIAVTWWAAGRLYELAAGSSITCAPLPPSAPLGCSPAPGTQVSPIPMSEADLLHVARSVVAR